MRIHLVEELEGRWQLRQQRARVTQVHGRHIAALDGVDEALGHSVALWAADERVDGLEPQCACQSPRVSCDVGTLLSPRSSTSRPCGTASTEPKRRSTASMSISRTGSPGNPLPSHARHAMTSRSLKSLVKVAVTVWPELHLISNPSEHQRRSLLETATRPSCVRDDWRRRGALGTCPNRSVRHRDSRTPA